jgi:ribosomal protein S18 acetylase RimI-like enzyme
MENITIKLAETDEELNQILVLQTQNHFQDLSVHERNANGFVTVKHNLPLLKKMNDHAGQIIAVANGNLVGYALVMLKEFNSWIPVLTPMFEMFEKLSFDRKPLSNYAYYVMGQICIAESFRGQGIFERLYQKHKEVYSAKFELCLTEVSVRNARSMKAHEKIGFKTIHSFEDKTDTWNILLWDWEKPISN